MTPYELARKQADAARVAAVQRNLPPERRPLNPAMLIEVRDYDAIVAEVERLRCKVPNFVASLSGRKDNA